MTSFKNISLKILLLVAIIFCFVSVSYAEIVCVKKQVKANKKGVVNLTNSVRVEINFYTLFQKVKKVILEQQERLVQKDQKEIREILVQQGQKGMLEVAHLVIIIFFPRFRQELP